MKHYFQNWTIADYSIASLLLVFVAFNKLMPILFTPLLISLFFERKGWKEFKNSFRRSEPGIWFICFYVIHIVGLIYTENMNYAFSDLGMKSSFLLLPLLLYSVTSKMTNKQVVDILLFGLFIACFSAYSYAVYRSFYNAEDNHWAYFTESYLSHMMHKSYFASYMAIGAVLSALRFFSTKKWIYVFLLLLFSVTVILTFSKAGILILLATLFPSLIILTIRNYSKRIVLILTGLSIATIVFIFNVSNTLNARFYKMLEGTTNVSIENNTSIESSQARIIMWTTSFQLLKEHPWAGVGTGDVSDELDTRNIELGNVGVAEKSYNSHNQYLNTAVQLGLMGLIPLLFVFLTSILKGILRNSFSLLMVAIILFLSLLFESFLETQQGIIPVTLLLLIFSLKPDDKVMLRT